MRKFWLRFEVYIVSALLGGVLEVLIVFSFVSLPWMEGVNGSTYSSDTVTDSNHLVIK